MPQSSALDIPERVTVNCWGRMERLSNISIHRLHIVLFACLLGAIACQSTPSASSVSADTLVDDRDSCNRPISEWATGKLVAPYNYGAELFSITPYFRNGEFEGYRIYPGENASQFAANGLEPGDLLTMIDGSRVTICHAALSDSFESLRNGKMISITRHRGREFAEMHFNLSLQ